MINILYISYDGILEPLGRSQVVKYLEKISTKFSITLISFEKKNDLITNDINLIKSNLKDKNIEWIYFKYHKYPKLLSTFFDIIVCLFFSIFLIKKNNIKIIHARSYVPGLISYIIKKFFKVKFIFDMRGFWADERVDGNIWKKNSIIYKIAKFSEKKMFLNSDTIISLTKNGLKEINNINYMKNISIPSYVIPTCTDFNQFNFKGMENNDNFNLGYVGAIGVWYDFNKVVLVFDYLKKIIPDSKLTIINKNEHRIIKNFFKNYEYLLKDVKIISVDHKEIQKKMMYFDASIFFIKKCFSKKASCPTKLGELLGMGVPVLTGSKIGDVDEIIYNSGKPVGVIIEEFSEKNIINSLKMIIEYSKNEEIRIRCVNVSKENFNLDEGVKIYKNVYEELSNNNKI